MAHVRKYDSSNKLIARLRTIILAFPDAFEKEAWGEATFRVDGGTMFAMSDCDHHDSGHIAVWVKAPPLAQEHLIEKNPARFFRPPYMGPKGWVGVRLESKDGPVKVDWMELEKILRAGYELSVPKRKKKAAAKKKKAGAKKPGKKVKKKAAGKKKNAARRKSG